MSGVSNRSVQKEMYWRGHLSGHSASGGSIRSYCLRQGLSEASFHFWRREIAARDRDTGSSPKASAGLIAVEIVGDLPSPPAARPTLEIEDAGGPVIRLREDAPLEVLHRVLAACRTIDPAPAITGHDRSRAC